MIRNLDEPLNLDPEGFGGTDEGSHFCATKQGLDDPFAVHPTPASGTPMPDNEAEYHTLIDNLKPTSLDFAHLREKNQERLHTAFSEHANWSPVLWALCAAGEMGEACNAIKKHFLRHEANPTTLEIGHEIADVIIYLDLLATSLGFHLEDLVAEKFNIVSERKGCEVML